MEHSQHSPRQKLSRRFTPQFLLALLIAGLVALTGGWYWDLPPHRRGLPPGLDTEPLSATAAQDSRWYSIDMLLNVQTLWQASVADADMKVIARRLELQPVAMEQVSDNSLHQPPYWWRPARTRSLHYFADADWSDTNHIGDGIHAFAAYDPITGLLYVWVRDIF